LKEESDENKSGASSQDYGEHVLSSSGVAPHETHKTLITQFKNHDICSARADSSSVSSVFSICSAFVGQDHCCEDLEAMYDATHSIQHGICTAPAHLAAMDVSTCPGERNATPENELKTTTLAGTYPPTNSWAQPGGNRPPTSSGSRSCTPPCTCVKRTQSQRCQVKKEEREFEPKINKTEPETANGKQEWNKKQNRKTH
jgi:hypothetical protein